MKAPLAEQLLDTPLPVDRVAARVTRKARPEHLWAPKPKQVEHNIGSSNALRVAPMSLRAPPEILAVVGKRRGRMTVLGYAAEQHTERRNAAAWVVRCDCGNFEHRKRILRWLGTDADDMCRECQKRLDMKRPMGWTPTRPKAERKPLTLGDLKPGIR